MLVALRLIMVLTIMFDRLTREGCCGGGRLQRASRAIIAQVIQ